MATFKEYLEMDGGLITSIALFNSFSNIGDNCYSSVCGGFNEGAQQWRTHNVDDIIECSNDKYTGWTILFNGGQERKVYIPNWVLIVNPKSWKHAKNLFSKYLRIVPNK